MNRISCPQEVNVSNAARTGRWDESCKAHVQQCAHCREIAGIIEWMGNVARTDAAGAALPDPKQVLLSARLAAIQAAREKALRPLAIIELIVKFVVIFALAVGVFGVWLGLRLFAGNLPSSYPHVPQPVGTVIT